jgi:carbonic anhydrase
MQDAWANRQQITVHGWIYGLNNGHLHDLAVDISDREQMLPIYDAAISRLVQS